MSEFKGQNILITGAASGIGKLMATSLAAEGANLILWDINKEGIEAVKASLSSYPGTAGSYTCDLSNREAIQATADLVLEDFGHVDILINNAGIVSGRPLMDLKDEHIERTFAVNTLALFWTTRAFMPTMIENGRGHIVTLASAGGIVGTARMTDYCSSKFAAIGFDESLRLEIKRLGLPLHTTVVCPFYIDTGMFEGVKTRFSWLLPILKPEYVARRIIESVRKKRKRLIMPRFVYTVFPIRILPIGLFDEVLGFFGINRSMDEFTGRTGH